MKKVLIIYGFNSLGEEQVQHMEKFDYVLISAYPGQAAGLSQLKQRKPSVKVFVYQNGMAMRSTTAGWDVVNANESWFVHDVYGNRVINKTWGWYLMDVGNQEYRDFWISRMLGDLMALGMADGVFMDDVWGYLKPFWTVPDEQIPPEVKDRWYADQLEMIRQVKAAMSVKTLVINSQERPIDYIRSADGIMMEGFAHPSWWSVNVWGYDSWNVSDYVEEFRSLRELNKIVLVHDGAVLSDPTTPEEERSFREIWLYSLGTYLLASDGKTAIGFGNWWRDPYHGYQSEMELDVGYPLGDYYIKDNIYMRDFFKAKVLVNLSRVETYSTTVNEEVVILPPHSTRLIPTPTSPIISLVWLTFGLTPIITIGGVVTVQELKKAGVMP